MTNIMNYRFSVEETEIMLTHSEDVYMRFHPFGSSLSTYLVVPFFDLERGIEMLECSLKDLERDHFSPLSISWRAGNGVRFQYKKTIVTILANRGVAEIVLEKLRRFVELAKETNDEKDS